MTRVTRSLSADSTSTPTSVSSVSSRPLDQDDDDALWAGMASLDPNAVDEVLSRYGDGKGRAEVEEEEEEDEEEDVYEGDGPAYFASGNSPSAVPASVSQPYIMFVPMQTMYSAPVGYPAQPQAVLTPHRLTPGTPRMARRATPQQWSPVSLQQQQQQQQQQRIKPHSAYRKLHAQLARDGEAHPAGITGQTRQSFAVYPSDDTEAAGVSSPRKVKFKPACSSYGSTPAGGHGFR